MTPRLDGTVAPGFQPVADVLAAQLASGDELGAGFAVRMNGETLLDLTGGHADRARSTPFDHQTLVPVYSTTKGIAALVLAHLLDALPAGYDTPVADLWPAFGVRGKSQVTIGELASHQAGLPGFAAPIDPALWLDPPACAAAIADLAPMWPPGTAHGYHPLTWGYLVGEIARRISGETLGTTLRRVFCAPNAIDFHIGLPASDHDRCAELQRPRQPVDLRGITPDKRAAFLERWSAPDRSGAVWREIEIPSANGHGTALAVARLYEIYAQRGRLGGKQLITDALLSALMMPWTDGPDRVLGMHTAFGAGIMLNTHGAFGPNPQACGHSGWGGSMAIADPDRGLACAYVMNRQSHVLVGDPRATALVSAVYGCL
jgi:CubicO group peptidase (beta-lactamase class C family)